VCGGVWSCDNGSMASRRDLRDAGLGTVVTAQKLIVMLLPNTWLNSWHPSIPDTRVVANSSRPPAYCRPLEQHCAWQQSAVGSGRCRCWGSGGHIITCQQGRMAASRPCKRPCKLVGKEDPAWQRGLRLVMHDYVRRPGGGCDLGCSRPVGKRGLVAPHAIVTLHRAVDGWRVTLYVYAVAHMPARQMTLSGACLEGHVSAQRHVTPRLRRAANSW